MPCQMLDIVPSINPRCTGHSSQGCVTGRAVHAGWAQLRRPAQVLAYFFFFLLPFPFAGAPAELVDACDCAGCAFLERLGCRGTSSAIRISRSRPVVTRMRSDGIHYDVRMQCASYLWGCLGSLAYDPRLEGPHGACLLPASLEGRTCPTMFKESEGHAVIEQQPVCTPPRYKAA
jgi:hypothetical protein